jgi:hypothetical protein
MEKHLNGNCWPSDSEQFTPQPRFTVRYLQPGFIDAFGADIYSGFFICAILEREAMCQRYGYVNSGGYFAASSSMLMSDCMGALSKGTFYRRLRQFSEYDWFDIISPKNLPKLFKVDLDGLAKEVAHCDESSAYFWREVEEMRPFVSVRDLSVKMVMPPDRVEQWSRPECGKHGVVYVMSNPLYDRVKVGYTTRTAYQRAKELSSPSGVAEDFVVEYSHKCDNPKEVESFAHSLLAECRYGRTEFFGASIESAVAAINCADSEVNS